MVTLVYVTKYFHGQMSFNVFLIKLMLHLTFLLQTQCNKYLIFYKLLEYVH